MQQHNDFIENTITNIETTTPANLAKKEEENNDVDPWSLLDNMVEADLSKAGIVMSQPELPPMPAPTEHGNTTNHISQDAVDNINTDVDDDFGDFHESNIEKNNENDQGVASKEEEIIRIPTMTNDTNLSEETENSLKSQMNQAIIETQNNDVFNEEFKSADNFSNALVEEANHKDKLDTNEKQTNMTDNAKEKNEDVDP